MNPEIIWIAAGVGGVLLVTGILAAKEYNKELNGPRYISRNWTVSKLPSNWNNKLPQVRLSNTGPRKYGWTETDTSRRTRVRNQDDNELDAEYDAYVRRPPGGWGGGRTKKNKK